MGWGSSLSSKVNNVDDSVRVMLKHDEQVQQREGQTVHGYKPREQHPLYDNNDQERPRRRMTATAILYTTKKPSIITQIKRRVIKMKK